jgi:hypothetical protein
VTDADRAALLLAVIHDTAAELHRMCAHGAALSPIRVHVERIQGACNRAAARLERIPDSSRNRGR